VSDGAASATAGAPVLRFEQVTKTYPDGRRQTVVLEQASFEIHRG
jgi:hypothetical protein